MPIQLNSEIKKRFEKILRNFVDENLADKIASDVQKWLNEEIIPHLPLEIVRYKRDEHEAINTAITGPLEEKAKKIILPHIPHWMNPDVLTVIGIIGSITTAIGFYMGYKNHDYLGLVSLGLLVNWFGDSFDGSVARYWNRTRPNYGYYIDHIVDGISTFVMALGIAYSGFVRIDTAYILIVLYLLLEMHVLLVKTVENTFKYTFGLMGPTEGRILIAICSVYMYFSDVKYVRISETSFSQYDIALLIFATLMSITLFSSVVSEGLKLHKQDIKKWTD